MNRKEYHVINKYTSEILRNQGKINFSNTNKNLSHDQLTRIMAKKYQWQTHFLRFLMPFLTVLGVKIIIDDTIIEKPHSTASRNKGSIVRWVHSHKDRKVIKGIQLVMLMLLIGKKRIPIGIRIYDGSNTKIELALELLSLVRNKYKIKRAEVLFDSWYSSKSILKRINDYGWSFVCRIKKNRNVSDTKVKYIFPNPYNAIEGRIAGIKIILVRNRKHYLICNRLSYSKKDIITHYAIRGQIEETFKVLKVNFFLKSCQSRLKEAWENHIFLCLFSFVVVEFRRQESGISIYKAKSKFILRDYRSYLEKWKRILEDA